jgi:hypothetical protein
MTLGSQRLRSYALRRTVRAIGRSWPLYRIDESGRAATWATMHAVFGGFVVTDWGTPPAWLEVAAEQGCFPGLPFFLQDMRPQGYIGRTVAREVMTRLGVPENPANWSDDDVLGYLVAEGRDAPGDFIVGDVALTAWHSGQDSSQPAGIEEQARAVIYPRLADMAAQSGVPGSSAGGEQPKFLARRGTGAQSVLVKFSSRREGVGSAIAERWGDLLVAERMAASVLQRHGQAAAASTILEADGRIFLEVERFDRVGRWGRRGVLSLMAVREGLVDRPAERWSAAAAELRRLGLIDEAARREIVVRECFGQLIANTDMHAGNLGFWFDQAGRLSLTPTYDMLPMQFAPPASGDMTERVFAPAPPLPIYNTEWNEAAVMATDFWSEVARDGRASVSFRERAAHCGETVARLVERFGR